MERVIGKLDYLRLEAQIKFHFKDDLYKAIGKLGFKRISECVATLYYGQGLPCYKIAALLDVNKQTVNRWMAAWGMVRRNDRARGMPWTYSKFCKDCGCVTVPGYRAKGRCWICYAAKKREEAKVGSTMSKM